MNTNIHSINLPKIVQMGWRHHVDFCVWKNRPLILTKGVCYHKFTMCRITSHKLHRLSAKRNAAGLLHPCVNENISHVYVLSLLRCNQRKWFSCTKTFRGTHSIWTKYNTNNSNFNIVLRLPWTQGLNSIWITLSLFSNAKIHNYIQIWYNHVNTHCLWLLTNGVCRADNMNVGDGSIYI